jgi:undecaprenyl-diphosphatase
MWGWAIALGLLAVAVKSGALVAVDQSVGAWADTIRTPGADAAAKALSFFGSAPWTFAVGAVMGGWWLAKGRHDTLLVFLSAAALGLALQALLRLWVGQWRPEVGAVAAPMDLATRYDLAGFTSGHGFRSAFLYGWWGRELLQRRTWWATGGAVGLGLLIVAIGATRLCLRRHWASDIMGAWLVALIALSLARGLSRRPWV